jgi:hypothetical protein
MTFRVQSPLPTIRKTRFNITPGQPISVHDFLRGLKRPVAAVTPTRTLHEVAPARPTVSDVHNSHLLDPPESCPQEEIHEFYHGIDSLFQTEEPEPSTKSMTQAGLESMRAPDFIRTYSKRARPTPSRPKLQSDESPALFCTQASADPCDESRPLPETDPLSPRKPPLSKKPSRRRTDHQDTVPDVMERRRAAPTKAVKPEPERATALEWESDGILKLKKKTESKKPKKRRAPVNELALVSELPAKADSLIRPKRMATNAVEQQGNLVQHLLGLEPVDERDHSPHTAKRAKKANIGKPVTRLRKDTAMPQERSISHEGFKFPPATPKAKRFPGWKMGSGFEGIRLDQIHGKRPSGSCKGTARRSKIPGFTTPSLRPLELSVQLSPTERKLRPSFRPTHRPSAMPAEARNPGPLVDPVAKTPEAGTMPGIHNPQSGDQDIQNQVRALTALLRPRNETSTPARSQRSQNASIAPHTVLKPGRPSNLCPEQVETSQSIREPSKSEQNGWLKRRRIVIFADEIDKGFQPASNENRQAEAQENAKQTLEMHEAKWYGEERREPLPRDVTHANSAAHHHGFASQIEPIEEDEDTLNNAPPSHQRRQSGFYAQSLKGTTPRAWSSPRNNTQRPFMRVPSSQFQVAASSRPLEVQDSQDQRDIRRSLRKQAMKLPRNMRSQIERLPVNQEGESSEIDEMGPESLDLSQHPNYSFPEVAVNAGRYFSNAVQQLSSPAKGPQSVPRRKSHTLSDHGSNDNLTAMEYMPMDFVAQQGAYGVSVIPTKGRRPFQMKQVSLELGMTPRLRRTMSSVPFRPPFKELV